MKDNVKEIKPTKPTQCFSYEVVMLVHIIADNEATAQAQLNEKGGIVTKREVKLVNTTVLYGEDKDEKWVITQK
jgi:hypothetical protein